ncbi:glutathione S-transferase family protein [Novosphingobium sp. 1949]|uniref:Glutathione S-transferase family protein n=1 Tax=Novosphingobium organovorum TaxID=2930092 RepID=A0ABT0B859_9SPHN|nr:glutathione S-transferase family protein [Novosphingobium organovorum]MCJ2181252.1 glutathione S-transferase family protein [Novosphingobium organovorum]
MADYTFYTNPMSRGQIARWALHEVEADYDQSLVDWAAKSPDLLTANAMGKVPTLVHHAESGDRVVTEAAAVCLYLAEMHPEAELLPSDLEIADYYRWTFFCAGPVDQALTAKALGFEPNGPRQEAMASFGSFERLIATLDGCLAERCWICGDRFTMADVYVGSSIDWGLNFGLLPPNESFVAYAERCQARRAYKEAKAIDGALIAEQGKS